MAPLKLLHDVSFTVLDKNYYRIWTTNTYRFRQWDLRIPKPVLVSILMYSYAPQLPLHTAIIDKLSWAFYSNYTVVVDARTHRGKWSPVELYVNMGFSDHHVVFKPTNELMNNEALYLYSADIEKILESIKKERANVSGA